MANAAASPVASSVRAIGGSSGWPSGSPLMAANPPIASAIVANPGRPAYGPSWPNPEIRVIDESRVAGVQHVGAEPELLQPPGPEVLDEHGGVGDEAEQDVAVGVVLEVEDDRALAAVGELEPQALAVALVAPRHRAQAVAVGALDLDHVGAVVGEVAGAVGAGDHRRQVEHADVGEGERGRHGRTGSTITGTESPARSWAA